MKRGCGCLFAVPFLLGGLLFAGIGAFFLVDAIDRVSTSSETTGIIVGLETSSDGDTAAPIVEFEVDGVIYRFTSNFYRSPTPTVGDAIGVLYDPANPADAAENSRGLLWIFPIVFLVVGLAITAVAIWIFARRVASPHPQGRLRRGSRRVVVPGSEGSSDQEGVGPREGSRRTAQFRRVEPRGPDAAGRFEYRVVAKDEDGVLHYSDWLDTDPTTALISTGVDRLPIEERNGHTIVVGIPESEE